MRQSIRLLVALLTVLSFSLVFAADFYVDFSAATGFGTGPDTFQINNITVKIRDPLTGEFITRTYNVKWRFDYNTITLVPIGIAESSSQTCRDAILKVIVTNAINGSPVPNALVSVAGQTASTNNQGIAIISNLPEGDQQISVSANGYIAQSTHATLRCEETTEVSVSLLPRDSNTLSGDIRVILTWGEVPEDLDAHMVGPITSPSDASYDNHIYYSHKNNCDGSPCNPDEPVMLDVDDRDGYGPETITITKVNGRFIPGCYVYSVHHYSGESNIPNSGANVKVYIGSNLRKVYTPPPAPPNQRVGDNWVWKVFSLCIDETGNISITDLNYYRGPTTSGNLEVFGSF